MANNDPTAILSAVVAVPIAIVGNGIQYVVSNVLRMKTKAAAALEAGEELEIDLDQMERGESSEERYMNRGRQIVEEMRGIAEEASTFSIMNAPGRFMHSRKISKCFEGLGEYKSIQGIQMILKIMRSLKLQLHGRQDASFYLFSPPSCDSQLIQVGMEKNVEWLTRSLVESKVPWISITGPGGMGKSFLAQIVCNDPRVREYFGKSILWVDCGHCGHEDLDRKLQLMQEKLFLCFTGTEGSFTTLSRGNQVLQELMKSQSSHPYLLVLDNVRSRLVLKFFDFLGGVRIGSTIVTSRQQDILQDINDENDQEFFCVGELSDEEACELFCMHAFGDEVPPIGLKEYAMEFVQHCEGMPLMLEALGKFMRTKNRPAEWKYVLKQIEKKRSSTHEYIFEILRMSYDALDDMDKKRFLYLASTGGNDFPAYLIMMFHCWRGIDFLSRDEDIEIVREECKQALDRLSSASLIGVMNSSDAFIIQVPIMIRELADYIVRKDNLLNHSLRNAKCTTEVGQESFICSSAASIEIVQGDYISSLDYFSRFSNLRALTLTDLKNLRMFDATHVHQQFSLIQLRYLKIEFREPSKLQPLYVALEQLSKLEVLDIYGDHVAEDMTLDVGFLGNMSELMILSLMTPLRTSTTVINCDHIQKLRKLERMRLSFFQDWDWPSPKNLNSLFVSTRDTIECNGTSLFMTSLCASATLMLLTVRGVRFFEVPELHCPSLITLELEVAKERLPRGWLQSLPWLERLNIKGGGMLMEVPSLDNLPNLNDLDISGLAAEQWHITPVELTSLSTLRNLTIADCENLENVPTDEAWRI